jgi:hypothetical protein
MRNAVTAVSARAGATVGRRLRRLLLEEEFEEVDVEVITSTVTTFAVADRLILTPILAQALAVGAVDAAEVAALRQRLTEQDERGTFLLCLPTFIASGTRP